MSSSSLLIGDIGGTNARFALADAESPGFTEVITLKCADYESADLAIRQYLEQVGASSPDVVCLAAAGPVVEERVQFTNNHWVVSSAELREEFGIERVRLLNDFEAIAYAVPFFAEHEKMPIGSLEPLPLDVGEFTVGIVGPGTGLGVAGLIRRGDLFIPIVGEGSHGGFSPETGLQLELLRVLRTRFDRVSSERVVSGQGLENTYWALTRIHGEKRTQLSAAEIFAHSQDGSDPLALEAVQLFYEILGQVAGDLALTLKAERGVFIAGGIAQRYPEILAASGFRSAFDSKGRHRSLMERIPTQLITHAQPGLLGAAYGAMQLALGRLP